MERENLELTRKIQDANNCIIKQKISNHPLLKNIEREIVVFDIDISTRYNYIYIDAEFRFYDESGEDVTNIFVRKIEDWYITNQSAVTLRDKEGNPIKNPDYDPEKPVSDNNQKYQKVPAFDFFIGIIKKPNSPSLIKLLSDHIELNDRYGIFEDMMINNKK